MSENWRIWIDTGGTFTDCIALSPQGRMARVKVLSSSRLRGRLMERLGPGLFKFFHKWPVDKDIFKGYEFLLPGKKHSRLTVEEVDLAGGTILLKGDLSLESVLDFEITASEEAPVLAARLVTHTPLNAPLPPLEMRLGSTKGTNALLEKKGAGVTFLITEGFGDLMAIGTQQRPHLFQLDIPVPELLYSQVVEVRERIGTDGEALCKLTDEEIKKVTAAITNEVVAVAFMHAYRNPAHELQMATALKNAGFRYVSLSHQLNPSIKILPRAQTALVNAYLSPLLEEYLGRIRQSMTEGSKLLVMTSAGGLIDSIRYHAKDSLLSGPAGGVVGAAHIARRLGFEKALTLDMGGTSTDTARYDGRYDYRFATRIDHVEMLSPALAIETVAAGGGSICSFIGNRLTVGPESAGADPGPACYGAGGPLTVTDVNLLLGKLDPSVMGIPIRIDRAREALHAIMNQIEKATDTAYSETELLRGFEKIANEKMAEAIRRISVAKGFDPSDYALLAFGGAGGLHACRIAELLDISTIILPYDGGLLSAYGIGRARIERLTQRQVLRLLDDCSAELPAFVAELSEEAFRQLEAEGFRREELEIVDALIHLRFKGQDSTLEIEYRNKMNLESEFRKQYESLFGHYPENRPIEVESLKVVAADKMILSKVKKPTLQNYHPKGSRNLYSESGAPAWFWDDLRPGAIISGPAIILNKTSTAFIEEGWRLEVRPGMDAVVHRMGRDSAGDEPHKEAVALELFTNRFKAVAEEMGAQLQRTAFSVNIKERLDFSCAILDPQAELLVNAPHIPVHLGSLGVCARLVLEKIALGPGDVAIVNHPKYGGSHLPDVTLLSAVFSRQEELIGYVINRAHHAEIGGRRPGSMPPDAVSLAEEGVVFPPVYLVKNGKVQWAFVEEMLTRGPYPTRALAENLADINAALAALRSGEAALQRMVEAHGLEKVHYFMRAIKEMAREALEEALAPFGNRSFAAVERLDDGHEIHVRIDLKNGKVGIDFSGTSAVHPRNLNANVSIVFSAVIYVLRLLCKREIPLNEGLMQNVAIHLPRGSFLHPDFADDPASCPAVVGGNTETSQRLVDVLLKAFGAAACSQGTMNNFLFGDDRFGYYETIGGGAGAGDGFHGRSAVHQHMTNTKITDPKNWSCDILFACCVSPFATVRAATVDGKAATASSANWNSFNRWT
jgi:5-oxoprolinase (ATP-hydrolysing)